MQPSEATHASPQAHFNQESRWHSVWRMLGIVVLLWFLAQFVVLIAAGFLDGDLNGEFGPLDGGLILADGSHVVRSVPNGLGFLVTEIGSLSRMPEKLAG